MPSNLPFLEAEAFAGSGVYVRRPHWAYWWVIWRGAWHKVEASGSRILRHARLGGAPVSGDVTVEDYLAGDWTTAPWPVDDSGNPLPGVGDDPAPDAKPDPGKTSGGGANGGNPPWPNPNPGQPAGDPAPGSPDGTGQPGETPGTGGSAGGGATGGSSGGTGGGTGGGGGGGGGGAGGGGGGGGGGGVACNWGTLTLNATESCPGAVNVELVGTGLSGSPQTYSVLFFCRGQTFSGGIVFGPNFVKAQVLTGSPPFATHPTLPLVVTAQLTGFSGSPASQYPCAGQSQTVTASVPFYCLCRPQPAEMFGPPWNISIPACEVTHYFDGEVGETVTPTFTQWSPTYFVFEEDVPLAPEATRFVAYLTYSASDCRWTFSFGREEAVEFGSAWSQVIGGAYVSNTHDLLAATWAPWNGEPQPHEAPVFGS